MKTTCKQIHLSNLIEDFDQLIEIHKPILLKLFEDFIDIKSFIPHEFYDSYYKNTGHPRDYSLESMISAFIFMKFFSIPSVSLLLTFLTVSSELRIACGFTAVPHKSQFSRFLSDFYDEISLLFHRLVDLTQPICDEIDPFKAYILISDTTGFEAYVKESNPKFLASLLQSSKKLGKFLKKKGSDEGFNVHAHAYSQMPKSASSNPDMKLCYLNGHFDYYLKSNIVTNGLGIIRYVDFYEPEIESDEMSPKDVKDEYDSKTLIPVLKNFFDLHPDFSYKYFLGDSGMDAYDNYKYLIKEQHMIPIIPINPRNQSNLPESGFNELGIPTCPYDPSLPMKFDGITRESGRADRIKYLCPKSEKTRINGKTAYLLSCDNPCTSSPCGRIKQIAVDSDYRFNSVIPRGSDRWNELYKIRTVCERTIAQIKSLICIESTKLRKTVSIKSNILFAAITQLISLIILHKTNNTEHPMVIKGIAA